MALAELQSAVDASLRNLGLGSLKAQALRLENGELMLACASSAQKARLNHVRPELGAELARRGWDCRSIRIGHQLPSALQAAGPARREPRTQIDPQTRSLLARAAQDINNPALAQAIRRLAQGQLKK
ncbi:MAG TPA: hypothetical protein VFK82_06770 [Burkholderiaceae bacterium]|nr:hypothetical protein [Burkholderiaceae bacterium]